MFVFSSCHSEHWRSASSLAQGKLDQRNETHVKGRGEQNAYELTDGPCVVSAAEFTVLEHTLCDLVSHGSGEALLLNGDKSPDSLPTHVAGSIKRGTVNDTLHPASQYFVSKS